MNNQKVIPIFFQVDPSDVRKQTGNFKNAFVKHERMKEMKEKVQRWRVALTEVGNLSGWDSSKTKSDVELVENMSKIYQRN
ncbi:disease resistance protein RLM3-like [Pistacia vera]|uniref:disease resistance protein RLM3-like n=1 Tax=Pistacia vera TaxID=55513 RepID=UPI00126327EB|nr:disease resistance protein RLM3-like [Pistacia vera]